MEGKLLDDVRLTCASLGRARVQRLSCGVVDFTGDISSDKTSLNHSAGLLLLGRHHVRPE